MGKMLEKYEKEEEKGKRFKRKNSDLSDSSQEIDLYENEIYKIYNYKLKEGLSRSIEHDPPIYFNKKQAVFDFEKAQVDKNMKTSIANSIQANQDRKNRQK